MKYHGKITDDKDLVTKEYVDGLAKVQSVNNQTGDVVLDATDVGALPSSTPIPTKTSDLQNDSGFISSSDITGAASTVITNNLDPSVVMVTDGNGKIADSDITTTELGFLDGATSNVQSQINNLDQRIDDITAIGRFLAYWNCVTGLPNTNPTTSPYTYHTGDYFVVSTVGTTNYKPTGSSYTSGVPSTVEETDDVAPQDIYRYDGTAWALAKNTQPDLSGYVATFNQSFTDPQKEQARSNIGAGTYSKPSDGIPKRDLSSAVQSSLDKADSALKNTATQVGSLTILGNATPYAKSLNIGTSTTAYQQANAIGYNAQATGNQSNAIGINTEASGYASVAIGVDTVASLNNSIAIGNEAVATSYNSVQIGQGTNSNQSTLQFRSYQLLDSNGKIPNDRLSLDTTPVSSSSKPVTSGGVYTALQSKQNTLTFDSTPTQNSTNPVTSGGIYNALAGKQNKNIGTAYAGQYLYVGSTGEISTVSGAPIYQNEDPYAVHYTTDTPTTTEQEIARNNIDVYSTEETDKIIQTGLDNRIKKFYTTNRNNSNTAYTNHVSDSDDGAVRSLRIYGKGSQGANPSPSNPQTIHSVVNPKLTVCGKNIFGFGQNVVDNTATWRSNPSQRLTAARVGDNEVIFRCASGTWSTALLSIYGIDGTQSFAISFDVTDNNTGLTPTVEVYSAQSSASVLTLAVGLGNASAMGTSYGFTMKNIQVERGPTATAFTPYEANTATLAKTLNAIPVASGGNITIDGQQYIADYVDVERKKLVRMCYVINNAEAVEFVSPSIFRFPTQSKVKDCESYTQGYVLSNKFARSSYTSTTASSLANNMSNLEISQYSNAYAQNAGIVVKCTNYSTVSDFNTAFSSGLIIIYALSTPTEESLTDAQVADFLAMRSYYPQTNIAVTSDDLDGQATFLYPCSMENFVEYVKEELGDSRETVYDMRDISDQAFINAQYAEILAEMALDD